ncbi:MAG: UDP-glucose dehydrogenase family protein, partial [Spirochaetota bacterium]
MNIAVVGTGYVGLVTGTCLSDFGEFVTCVDIDKEKIDMLNNNIMPIYENGLEKMVIKNRNENRLFFTTDIKQAVENNDIIFIAVGTPPKEDGSADLKYVLSVAKDIGKYINDYKVIVDKSTVPIGTGRLVRRTIEEEVEKRKVKHNFDIVSNPEFLREGKAIFDFTHPDRVVIGTDSEEAKDIMSKVYRVLYVNQTPFVFTDLETAELIKYASNAFLAVKISFINELALLSEKIGANVQDVAKAMGMDGRISPKFLHAGAGYGGSCFPKDTKAIANIALEYKEELYVIDAA